MLDQVLTHIESGRKESIEGLKTLLRFPSVSTKPEHAGDMRACAEFLVKELEACGLTASVRNTDGHPLVLGKNKHQPGRPTVLFYGHYDVQPPEPIDEWKSQPFEPDLRKDDNGFDAIFARGAVDDKGQVWAHLQALKAWHKNGGVPVNLTVLIEGEEEIGSENLEKWVRENIADLKADIAIISDTNQFSRGVPAITYGLRGLVYAEVTVTGPSHDLHSGLYGGTLANPANVLCQILATLHDADGRVNIPGFYDKVRLMTPAENEIVARLPADDAVHAAQAGVKKLFGEKGFSTLHRQWARPTLDINGITSGYQGKGAKTIIPAKASAKVSMRLVPDMQPHDIEKLFRQTLQERCPSTVSIDVSIHSGATGFILPIESKAMTLAAGAVEIGFGTKPVFMRGGGTIPIVALLKQSLNLDTVLVGFGLSDDRVHSPNEKFDLDALYKGTRTAAALYGELAKL